MPVTVVNIGSSSTVVSGQVSVTIGAGGVPAKTQIIVFAADNSTTFNSSITDSVSNSYANVTANNGIGIEAFLFRVIDATALVNGNTITYTLSTGATKATVSAFYVTGLNGALAQSQQSGDGTGTSPSATGNVPLTAGNFWVACAVSDTTSSSFTQDSTNAPWASPPGLVTLNSVLMGGGWFLSSDQLAHTYAPTLGTSGQWVTLIASFALDAASGWEPQLPTLLRPRVERRSATRGSAPFAIFPDLIKMGWEIQPPQPPHPRAERSGAVAPIETGTEAVYVFVPLLKWGYETHLQLPRPRVGLRSATRGSTQFAIYPDLLKMGWEVQPPQPPHPRPERSGAVAPIEPGTEAVYVFVPPRVNWWEVQVTQPPHPRPERSAAWARGDEGTQAKLLPVIPWWEVHSFTAKGRPRQTVPLNDPLLVRLTNFLPFGWETQPPQPPRRRQEKSAAWLRGDDGTQAKFIQWLNGGWQPEIHYLPHPRPERFGAYNDPWFIPPINFLPFGWEVQSPQPPHPRVERSGAIAPIETGTEAVYVFTPLVPIRWGYELSLQPPRPRVERRSATRGGTHFAIYPDLLKMGWEVQSPQPPHPRPERSGSIAPIEPGVEAVYVFVPLTPAKWGYELSFQPPRPRVERRGATRGSTHFAIYPDSLKAGWEIQPPQPPHPRPERFGAIAPIEPGIEAVYIFVPPPVAPKWGWDIQYQEIRHPRLDRAEAARGTSKFAPSSMVLPGWDLQTSALSVYSKTTRAGAIAPIETGTEAVFTPPPPIRWGYELTFQPPRPRVERRSATRGNAHFAVYPDSLKAGWEVQPPQPPHPRPERSGAVAPIETGTEAVYVFVPFVPPKWGWDFQHPLVRHPRLDRAEAARGNSQFAPSSLVLPGWDLQTSALSVYSRTRRSGAVAPIETGIEAVYIFVPPPTWGYDLSFNPPRHRVEQRRSATRGSTNFAIFPDLVRGWEYQLPQPPHPSSTRAAAIVPGDDGTEAPIPPPVVVTVNWGYEEVRYSFKAANRISAMLRGDDGTQAPFVNQFYSGWEIQPPQPQHVRFANAAALMRGDDGTQAKFVFWQNAGWEIQPPPPPHRAPEYKAAAWFTGDDGIQAPLIRQFYSGWEVQPFQPPHRAPEVKAASWLRGDDGIQGTLIRTFYSGWEVQPVQPPHPRPERSAAWMRGDDGTQATIIRTFFSGWEIQPFQPPHRAPEYKAAAWFTGDSGTQATIIRTFFSGWEVQPVQPPHPRPERAGAVLYGDDGIYNIYVFVPLPPPVAPPGGGDSYWFLKAIEAQWEKEEQARQHAKHKLRALKKAQQKPPAQRALEKEIAPPAKAAPVQAKAPQTPPAKPTKPLVNLSEAVAPTSPPLVKPVPMTLPPDLRFTSSIAKRQQKEEDEDIIFLHMQAHEEQREAISLIAKLLKEMENE